MRLYYKAATFDGKIVHGVIESKSPSDAATYLRGKQFIPIKISEQSDNRLVGAVNFRNKFSGKDVIFFTRQLSSMLSSGLTLMQALGILKNQIQKESMNEVVNGMISDIQEGSSFSKALGKYPRIFSPIYIALVKAAETSGLLDKVMLRLAENLEKQQKLSSQIKSALMYPVIVIVLMIIVVFIMMIFVIPQLGSLYTSLNIDLPLPTKILIGMSNITVKFWPFILGAIFGGIFFFRKWHSTESGKKAIDTALLKLPVFGKLIRESVLTEFSRTFGLLVGSGTLVVESLNESGRVVGNVVYEAAISNVARRVEKGVPIGTAMSAYSEFPPLLSQMVKIGEQTGKLDESLMRSSEYFEREAEQTVKTLTTAMEPFIMVVLGAGVAFLLISVITPIYKLTSAF